MRSEPPARRLLSAPVQRFLQLESAGAILLLAATVSALVWATLAPGAYAAVWVTNRSFAGLHLGTARHAVSDGLMTVFFAAIALEIKREFVLGRMRDRRYAALPVIAATGGMVVPCVVYAALNPHGPAARGWAVPMATDVAFAVALLVALRRWVGEELTIFVLALAVADDVGAVFVIAVFYGGRVQPVPLIGVVAGAVTYWLLQHRPGAAPAWAAAAIGVLLWWLLYRAGVHPTLAGVVLGLLTRADRLPDEGRSPLEEWESRLHPVSSRVVVPLFALANAGLALSTASLRAAVASRVFLGVVVALAVGKPLGVTAATWLAVRLRMGMLPTGVTWVRFAGVSCAAGIGFTVSLFIADVALAGDLRAAAQLGVFGGSVLAAVACSAVLLTAGKVARDSSVGQ